MHCGLRDHLSGRSYHVSQGAPTVSLVESVQLGAQECPKGCWDDSKINQKKLEYNRQNGPATAVPFLTADGQRKHVAIEFCFIRHNVCIFIYIYIFLKKKICVYPNICQSMPVLPVCNLRCLRDLFWKRKSTNLHLKISLASRNFTDAARCPERPVKGVSPQF